MTNLKQTIEGLVDSIGCAQSAARSLVGGILDSCYNHLNIAREYIRKATEHKERLMAAPEGRTQESSIAVCDESIAKWTKIQNDYLEVIKSYESMCERGNK